METQVTTPRLADRMYRDSKAVHFWFDRCVFSTDPNRESFRDLEHELKEFAKAQHPGQEIEEAEVTQTAIDASCNPNPENPVYPAGSENTCLQTA